MKKTLLSPSHRKFLLDENVRVELYRFLKKHGYNVKKAEKAISDEKLALLSKSEKRILVTNDSDFTDPSLHTSSHLFSLIWLRLPQSKADVLLASFQRLLSEFNNSFEGKLFILKEDSWEVYDLGISLDFSI